MEKPFNEHLRLWIFVAIAALACAGLVAYFNSPTWQDAVANDMRWVVLEPGAYLLLAVVTLWVVVSRILKIRYTRCPKCLGRMHVGAVRCRHCHSDFDRSYQNSWTAWDEHVFTHADLLQGRHSAGYPLLLLLLMLFWGLAISPLLNHVLTYVGLGWLHGPVNWLAVLVCVGLWGLYALKNWRALLSILVVTSLGLLVIGTVSEAGTLVRQQGLAWLSWDAVAVVGEAMGQVFAQVNEWPKFAAIALGLAALFFWGVYAWEGLRAFCWVRDNHWLDPEVKDVRPFELHEATHVVKCFYCSKRMRVGEDDAGPHECPHCHEHRYAAYMAEWLWHSDDYPNFIDRVLGAQHSYFKQWFK